MSAIKPVTPAEALAAYEAGKNIPDFVVLAVNALINQHCHPNGFDVSQEDVIAALLAAAPSGTTRQQLFDCKWLDFEPMFRLEGWKVMYIKPDRGDTFSPYYQFRL